MLKLMGKKKNTFLGGIFFLSKPVLVLSPFQTIQIPDFSNDLRSFQFSLSAVQGDPNGSFDCVRQQDTKYVL